MALAGLDVRLGMAASALRCEEVAARVVINPYEPVQPAPFCVPSHVSHPTVHVIHVATLPLALPPGPSMPTAFPHTSCNLVHDCCPLNYCSCPQAPRPSQRLAHRMPCPLVPVLGHHSHHATSPAASPRSRPVAAGPRERAARVGTGSLADGPRPLPHPPAAVAVARPPSTGLRAQPGRAQGRHARRRLLSRLRLPRCCRLGAVPYVHAVPDMLHVLRGGGGSRGRTCGPGAWACWGGCRPAVVLVIRGRSGRGQLRRRGRGRCCKALSGGAAGGRAWRGPEPQAWRREQRRRCGAAWAHDCR